MDDSTVHALYQNKNSSLDGPLRELKLIGKVSFGNPFFRLFAPGLARCFAVVVSVSHRLLWVLKCCL